ncbi:multicopper oxidase family protein [Microbacterium sp. BH-3-3-3]|uniref:multicopper oxidase family protein n=1 Tax=Microbacterium sp. BH-3-3-3 TaxID=1906742 RepID=UPI000892897B|nr:multicopper oxidase family protein [Microbacterium sp. BH-3-3-3]AOX44903.1 copper oxidase [Microbacterium sp. BH-3-3-3]
MSGTNGPFRATLSRRGFLGVSMGAVSAVGLASCAPRPDWVQPDGREVMDAEHRRGGSGRVTDVAVTAAPAVLDLAGVSAPTWAFGSVPAPIIRLRAGDTLRANVRNQLDADLSVHWHGLALRNDMDGVPPLTQRPIAPGGEFEYRFIAPDPGTYWFHSHVGTQLDRGLYGALIIDDPAEPGNYDDEWVIVLDDWLDGVTATPDDVFTDLSAGMGGMSGMGDMFMRIGNTLMGATSALLAGDAGDVYYPLYLVNGKPPADPTQFAARPGSRVRLRIINAGGDTAFRFAIGGHSLTITHTDGFPVDPTAVDSILLGMGERYDATIVLGDGVFPLVAQAEGKRDRAFAVIRTADGAPPAPDATVAELSGDRLGVADRLTAASGVGLMTRAPDRAIDIALTGGMEAYDWGIDGNRFDMSQPLARVREVREGERVRMTITNDTDMWHPFHLHGHTYQHAQGGPRKDTSIVLPRQTLTVDFDADNPGVWLAHCHNVYHAESGMATVIGYRRA